MISSSLGTQSLLVFDLIVGYSPLGSLSSLSGFGSHLGELGLTSLWATWLELSGPQFPIYIMGVIIQSPECL